MVLAGTGILSGGNLSGGYNLPVKGCPWVGGYTQGLGDTLCDSPIGGTFPQWLITS